MDPLLSIQSAALLPLSVCTERPQRSPSARNTTTTSAENPKVAVHFYPMPIPLTYTEIEQLFESLQIKTFNAALPEGRIEWLDASGAVVAAGACQAILSWSGGNNSLMWAEAIAAFKDTGVPCLPAPDEETYQEDTTEAEAESLATQAAQLTNAQFLYDAPTGEHSKLFLAIRDFRPVQH